MDRFAAWLLTYLLHSTVLLSAAALCRIALGERRLVLQEAVLRAALLGGFLTASLQLGLGLQPIGGQLAVPSRLPVPSAVVSPAAVSPAVEISRQAAPATWALTTGLPPSSDRGPAATSRLLPHSWPQVLASTWGVLGLMVAGRLAVAAVRLRRLLRGRRPLNDHRLGAALCTVAARLGLRRTVRFSASPALSIPLATGLLRPEVCLPTRVIDEMAGEEQAALCAHELAHLARHDPTWLLMARLIEAVGALQPLNTWARRRLQDLSECLSDDLAMTVSAERIGLARSLVDVAAWTFSHAVNLPAVAAGAFGARSRLGHRVERIMNPMRVLESPRRLLLPLALLAALATALITPAVSGQSKGQEPVPPPAPTEPALAATPEETPEPPAPPAPPLPVTPAPAARPAPMPRPAPLVPSLGHDRLKSAHEPAQLELQKLRAEVETMRRLRDEYRDQIERLKQEMEGAAQAGFERDRRDAEAAARREATEAARQARQDTLRELSETPRLIAEQKRELARLVEEATRSAAVAGEAAAREAQGEAGRMQAELQRITEEIHRAVEQAHQAADEARRAAVEARKAAEKARQATSPEKK